jgi:hypothetical protein
MGEVNSDQLSYWNGYYTGIKGQCVELARRYYLIKYNLYFKLVENAKDIFYIHTILDLTHDTFLPWKSYSNDSTHPLPEVGSLLIWDATGRNAETGHVAVVTRVTKKYVDVIEQNYGDGHSRISIRKGVLISKGLLGWKQPV